MTTFTVRTGLACKHCPAMILADEQQARYVGWRIFRGESVTGKPIDDVVCPTCAGNAPAVEAKSEPGWRVRCETCDWEWEDEYDEGPLDARAAKDLARDHQCEPDVSIAPPEGDAWYDEHRITDDGQIRRAARAS